MANTQQGNIIYIDATANDIATDGILVYYAILTPAAANGYVNLLASSGGGVLVEFSEATDEDSKLFDFSRKPLFLSKGVHSSVSNATLMLVYEKVGGNK